TSKRGLILSPDIVPSYRLLAQVGTSRSYAQSIAKAVLTGALLSKDIIRALNGKMIELAKTQEMKATLWAAANAIAPLQTPEDMAKHLESDSAANAEVIKAANVKIE
ncbi:MAG: hypothetical protein ACKVP3_23350, partial [Hyphomicrobiaceae bacterium]